MSGIRGIDKKTKKEVLQILKEIGATDIQMKKGYGSFSGFFMYKGIIIYIAKYDNRASFFVREAKNYDDCIGGVNYFVDYAGEGKTFLTNSLLKVLNKIVKTKSQDNEIFIEVRKSEDVKIKRGRTKSFFKFLFEKEDKENSVTGKINSSHQTMFFQNMHTALEDGMVVAMLTNQNGSIDSYMIDANGYKMI